MGGGPKISGGMTKAEYDIVLAEQRKYAEESDAKREAKLAEYEQKRLASEKELINAQKRSEMDKISAQQDAEKALADEIESAEEEDTEELSSNFYNSLYTGVNTDTKRPE